MSRDVVVLTERLPEPGMRILEACGDVDLRVLPEPGEAALAAALAEADAVIMAMEQEFEVEIKDEDAENIRTVADAVQYINEHAD